MKVVDYDKKIFWIEQITLDKFNKLLQADILRNIFRFWKSTKDSPPVAIWGSEPYEKIELAARKYLAETSGPGPNQANQNKILAKQKTLSIALPDNVASGLQDVDNLDSASKQASNDSLNVPKSNIASSNDVDKKQSKFEIQSVSLQDVHSISSEGNAKSLDNGHAPSGFKKSEKKTVNDGEIKKEVADIKSKEKASGENKKHKDTIGNHILKDSSAEHGEHSRGKHQQTNHEAV